MKCQSAHKRSKSLLKHIPEQSELAGRSFTGYRIGNIYRYGISGRQSGHCPDISQLCAQVSRYIYRGFYNRVNEREIHANICQNGNEESHMLLGCYWPWNASVCVHSVATAIWFKEPIAQHILPSSIGKHHKRNFITCCRHLTDRNTYHHTTSLDEVPICCQVF